MIFAHGQLLPDTALPGIIHNLETEINATRAAKNLRPEAVVSALEILGNRLKNGDFDSIFAGFFRPYFSISDILPLLTRETIEQKLHAELGPAPFAPVNHGRTTTLTVPLGVLFHITPGNQPGLPVYSVLEGLLTGNINILKLPHQDKGLSLAALKLLTDEAPELADFVYAFDVPSSDTATLKALAALADGVVTWGGDAAVLAARELALPNTKLMEWGHRLSFAYIAGYEDEEAELAALAAHIAATRQRLCSSCQVIFLDTASAAEAAAFAGRFLPRLEAAVKATPYGLPGGGAMASLSGQSGWLERIVDGRTAGETVCRGRGCSVIVRPLAALELSPTEANVLASPLPRGDLLSTLRREKQHLQTAALLCRPQDRAELTDLLCRAGLTRITRAGEMSHTFPGEAHDGEYALRRYVRLVDVEN